MNEIDTKIAQLQENIAKKKDEIAKYERPSWETNCLLEIDGIKKNLQVISSEEECVNIFAVILGKYQNFEQAAKTLNSSTSPMIGGYTLSQWSSDFLTRLGIIRIQQERTKLQKLEKMLETLESDDVKRNKLLQQIEMELK